MRRRRWSKKAKPDPQIKLQLPSSLIVWCVPYYIVQTVFRIVFMVSMGFVFITMEDYFFGYDWAHGGLYIQETADLLLYITLPTILVCNLASIGAKQLIASKLVGCRFQRCPRCFEDLSNRSQGEHHCLKCGRWFARRDCVLLWSRLLRSRI
jgi:hypothetical protein